VSNGEFVSSLAPARGGLIRRLVDPLIDPATFDFWLGHLNRTWTWERPLARVVERRVEAADAVTLVLKPNRHWRGFRPGQHLNIGAEIHGRRVTRSYSLTDVPRRDGRIAITVKRVPEGLLSNHLCDRVQVGDVLSLDQAYGDMALPAKPQGDWLLLAAGSGITPLMSLTRALAAGDMPDSLTLIYWAGTAEQLCFAQELRALAAREPRFKLHLLLTQDPAAPASRIDATQLQALLGPQAQWSGLQVLACGPGGFVETARRLLRPQVQSFVAEAFSPAVPVNVDDAHEVTVQLRRSGRSLTISSGDSLLAALEAQGVRPPSGCRMGICHSCVCTKHEGLAQNIDTGERDGEPESELRLCVSRACSDISLDL
jgi:stearoyl-CoA 9-desaturase NADPH oxidoreductase